MKTTRPYTMRARAAAVQETRRRILQATLDLAAERLFADISLDAVATGAGVSVQTVLRQFGSRAALIEATIEYGTRLVAEERRAPAGDLDEAVRLLVEHYERRGEASLLLLAQESADAAARAAVEQGRSLHRTWVAESFAPMLDGLAPAGRRESLDLLAVATDVYTWKQLRRDQGLSRALTEARITTLVAAVLGALATTGSEGSC